LPSFRFDHRAGVPKALVDLQHPAKGATDGVPEARVNLISTFSGFLKT
jgi:hypothetical protein